MTSPVRLACLFIASAVFTACNCGPATPQLATTWKYRFSCSSTTQCFDSDVCETVAIVADPAGADRYKNSAGTMSGTLTGTTFRWRARWGTPPYDEVGVWTFSSDFSSFTQSTCYTYDGVADEATTTCTGQNRGTCSGSGAKTNPGPPAAVGACDAGSATTSCT